MAEIKVEKKKPIWPWIVGILAVLLIIFLLFTFMDDNGNDDVEERTEEIEQELDSPADIEAERDIDYPNNAVASFLYYMDEEYEESEAEETGEFPQEAMQKLAEAVEEKIRELQDEPSDELEEITIESFDTTATTAQGTMTIEEIQRKGEIIVNALAEIQETFYEDLDGEIADLRSDLEDINQTTEGEEQAEAVNGFFSQAAEVLREMPPKESGATMEQSQPADTEGFSTDVDTIEADDN